MRLVIRIKVTRHAVMGSCVRAVRSDIHLNNRVVLYVVVLTRRHAYRRVFRKDDDTGMVSTYADLIFCADHTKRVLAAQLTFLDRKRLIAVIEDGTDGSHYHFLARCYVRRTAHDRQRFALTDVDGRQM